MNICLLSSSRGTTLQAILEEWRDGKMPGVEVKFVLVDREDCGAAEKAKKAGLPLVFLNSRDSNGKKIDREAYDQQLTVICQSYGIQLIVLAGWMRLFSKPFVQRYHRKIINIHPSLLPKYPGMDLDVHAEVLKQGERESGMTIHYVDEGMDTGEIIFQKSLPIEPGETPESLKAKVQELEKQWYPEAIRSLAR